MVKSEYSYKIEPFSDRDNYQSQVDTQSELLSAFEEKEVSLIYIYQDICYRQNEIYNLIRNDKTQELNIILDLIEDNVFNEKLELSNAIYLTENHAAQLSEIVIFNDVSDDFASFIFELHEFISLVVAYQERYPATKYYPKIQVEHKPVASRSDRLNKTKSPIPKDSKSKKRSTPKQVPNPIRNTAITDDEDQFTINIVTDLILSHLRDYNVQGVITIAPSVSNAVKEKLRSEVTNSKYRSVLTRFLGIIWDEEP